MQLKMGKWPLYTFSGDAAPGDVNGQGSGGSWFVVGQDGKLIKGSRIFVAILRCASAGSYSLRSAMRQASLRCAGRAGRTGSGTPLRFGWRQSIRTAGGRPCTGRPLAVSTLDLRLLSGSRRA